MQKRYIQLIEAFPECQKYIVNISEAVKMFFFYPEKSNPTF